jgi:hypothetical protein
MYCRIYTTHRHYVSLYFIQVFHPSNGAAAQIGPSPPPFTGFLILLFRRAVRLIWTSDQPVAKASTNTGQHKNKHPCPQRDSNPPTNQAAYALDCAATDTDFIPVLFKLIILTITKQFIVISTDLYSGDLGYLRP